MSASPAPAPRLRPGRSRADTGWRLAGLLGLMLVTFVWMPLGARDAAGVSSVLPALRPVALAQPAGAVVTAATSAPTGAVPQAPRPRAPVVATLAASAAAVLVAAAAVVVGRRPTLADVPRLPALATLADRAPPLVP